MRLTVTVDQGKLVTTARVCVCVCVCDGIRVSESD